MTEHAGGENGSLEPPKHLAIPRKLSGISNMSPSFASPKAKAVAHNDQVV